MKLILLFFLLIAYSIEMTRVYKNIKTYLPTNSNSNYFYLVNNDYYSGSTYIYFCLEYNDFSLDYNKIKVCHTNTNPGTNEESAINYCSTHFNYLTYYGSTTTSSKKKYYYKFYYQYSYYDYAVVYYSGNYNSGDLYVTADDSNLLLNDAAEALSTVAIVFIVIGSIIVIAVAIVISACCCACCACCRRSQSNIMPITQPAAYIAPNPVTYGATMPLQPPGVYSPY